MEKLTVQAPALYGDHHVIEARRLLLALPGVDSVYASSCFRVIEISYDPALIDAETLKAQLGGYLQELPVPVEAENQETDTVYFRHTTTYPQTQRTVSFAQQISATQPLWPCPGFDTKEGANG